MKIIIPIFLIIFLVSCQSASIDGDDGNDGIKRRDVTRYYQSSGIEKYFLTDIPEWLNFSKTARCERTGSIKFVDLPRIMNSFHMSYTDAIQFQYLLNKEREDKKRFYKSEYLLLKDEEIIFYDVSDKVQNGIYAFKTPKFNRVNIVWIDSFLNSVERINELIKLMESKEMSLGHPLFISMCLDHSRLKLFIKELKLVNVNILEIPFDLFSIYDSKKDKNFNFAIELDKLFRADQELHLYLPSENIPEEFIGTFKLHTY